MDIFSGGTWTSQGLLMDIFSGGPWTIQGFWWMFSVLGPGLARVSGGYFQCCDSDKPGFPVDIFRGGKWTSQGLC